MLSGNRSVAIFKFENVAPFSGKNYNLPTILSVSVNERQ